MIDDRVPSAKEIRAGINQFHQECAVAPPAEMLKQRGVSVRRWYDIQALALKRLVARVRRMAARASKSRHPVRSRLYALCTGITPLRRQCLALRACSVASGPLSNWLNFWLWWLNFALLFCTLATVRSTLHFARMPGGLADEEVAEMESADEEEPEMEEEDESDQEPEAPEQPFSKAQTPKHPHPQTLKAKPLNSNLQATQSPKARCHKSL